MPPAVDTELFNSAKRSDEVRNELCGNSEDRPLILYMYDVNNCEPRFIEHLRDNIVDYQLVTIEAASTVKPGSYNVSKTERLSMIYASVDAMIVTTDTPSVEYTVLEAQASGCPVVVPSKSPISQTVDDGVTGLLYRRDDVNDALLCVCTLMEDDKIRKQIVSESMRCAKSHDWGVATDHLIELYRTIS
jgi:phosphatidylinositol alpha 1,6-mannosyltransferase